MMRLFGNLSGRTVRLTVASSILLIGLSHFSNKVAAFDAPIAANSHASVGWMLPAVKMVDISGKLLDLNRLGRSGNGLVIAFHSTTCPVSRQYGPTLARLEQEFRAKSVQMVIVNPVATDSDDSIRELSRTFAKDVIFIHDRDESIAKALGVRSTTEAFVFDKALTLRYRGAVDDQFSVGTALDKPRHSWLANAVTALDGQAEISPQVTDPSGCLLALDSQVNTNKGVTYHNRISRIIQQNCQECHREGGLGPFSLETYEDLKAHRGMIRKEVDRGQMPPWFAAPATYESHPGWSNDRSLLPADKSDLLGWLAADMPEGDRADAPLPHRFSDTGWQIGQPDLVLKLPEPIQIAEQGKMPYQYRTVETGLTEDAWVQAIEIRPTERSVVHHVIVYVVPPDAQKINADADDDSAQERRGFFAGYVPGTAVMAFPEGYGKKLPKGSRLRFQIHYTPNGKKTSDQLELGVVYAKQKPTHEIKVIGVANPGIKIPARVANHVEVAQQKIPTDVDILGFMPHMHVRGKAFKYELIFPDGRRETLLDVPRYDFNWQLRYKLAKPISAPAGSTIQATAVFDNSDGNRANPDPSKTVTWGQQTDEEMMLGYVDYEIRGEPKSFDPPAQAAGGPLARLIRGRNREETQNRFFMLLDTDRDNSLSKKELSKLGTFFPRLRDNPDRLDNVFQSLDVNDDGKLSRDEMKAIRSLAGGG